MQGKPSMIIPAHWCHLNPPAFIPAALHTKGDLRLRMASFILVKVWFLVRKCCCQAKFFHLTIQTVHFYITRHVILITHPMKTELSSLRAATSAADSAAVNAAARAAAIAAASAAESTAARRTARRTARQHGGQRGGQRGGHRGGHRGGFSR